MTRTLALAALFALVGCYSNNALVKQKLVENGDPAHPLYVGHSDRGEVVIASTHYDAMSGLAITANELGLRNNADMVCDRETLTGSHVPKWICRYKKDVEDERQATRDWLDRPRNCQGHCGGGANAKTPH